MKPPQPTTRRHGQVLTVCGFCREPGGTLRKAANSVLVHYDCLRIYEVGLDDDEPVPKHRRRDLEKQY